MTSRHFLAWAIEWKIDHRSHPARQADTERRHGKLQRKLRDECLNTSWFWNLFDAR